MMFDSTKVAKAADMKLVGVDNWYDWIVCDDNGETVYLKVVENDVGCFDIVFRVDAPDAGWGFLCQVDAEEVLV